ncbi:MAG: immune inhibitor A [Solirubrobacteraceae bacterium]|nr:immune inhibitor A [Solirubrobacteraceae bacterium]
MTIAVFAALVVAAPAQGAPPRLDVYTGEIQAGQLSKLVALGIDRHELDVRRVAGSTGAKGKVRVETILSGQQAAELARDGIELAPKEIDGETVAQRATTLAAAPGGVFRKYSGADGLKAEFEQIARENPRITKLVTYGKTTQGKDIVALKVTRDARSVRDGKRPAALYIGAQHAREWITPEMIRRLTRHIVGGYSRDRQIRNLVDSTELWFVPVYNPDGYDWTFEPDQRLWRKNLRDNNGDGQIAPGDGVDLNRNLPTKWGYDNEGSSPNPASETYRGPSAGSEPETKAFDALEKRVGPEFLVNYHSAAELLLYGVGWQVATPTPDDVLYEAMAGDDAKPAIPTYDPDISAELYTTNGETDGFVTEKHHTLAFTPEMATCETAANSDPVDTWLPEDCGSVFEFPDDEALVQAEFQKNIPFALSVAKSADDPDDPESAVGRKAEDFRVDTFDVSYGDPQTVAVTAKRALRHVELKYRINGGRTRDTNVRAWRGGEKYGAESDLYYEELRGQIRGTRPGDKVEAWFTGEKSRRDVRSKSFTYTVKQDSRADVLVIADEDYKGVNPTYPAGTNAPKYAAAHVAAVQAAGHRADVWDTDAQGVPHDLGVLSHYKAVLWYLGDNRITQEPEDELISTPFGELPDIGVAEREQYLTLAVRDFLNEGGKLIHAGETAQYQGLPGISDAVGGLYYALNGDEQAECVISRDDRFFDDCLILADDFRQYWLGAFTRTDVTDPDSVSAIGPPFGTGTATLGGPVVEGDNPLDEAGAFQVTSDVLPVSEFPQFESNAAAEYPLDEGSPIAPIEGTHYAGAVHQDASYMRLKKTIDLTDATAAELRFQLSVNTEANYDHVIVEAHTVGQEDWTTLPDAGGATTTDPPAECAADGFLLTLHPFLGHYLGGADCTAPGSSGTWNAFTGAGDSWNPVAFDLSAYAGDQVEVSISYVSDPNTGGIGAFVDDTSVVVDGAVTEADGFEGATSTWTVDGPPADSPPNQGDWQIGERLLKFNAATATDDSVLLGFGLEQLADAGERAEVVKRALDGLLG